MKKSKSNKALLSELLNKSLTVVPCDIDGEIYTTHQFRLNDKSLVQIIVMGNKDVYVFNSNAIEEHMYKCTGNIIKTHFKDYNTLGDERQIRSVYINGTIFCTVRDPEINLEYCDIITKDRNMTELYSGLVKVSEFQDI